MSRQWQAYKRVAFRTLSQWGMETLFCLNSVPTQCLLFHISVMKGLVMFHRLVRTDFLARPVGVFLQYCFVIFWYYLQLTSEEVYYSG